MLDYSHIETHLVEALPELGPAISSYRRREGGPGADPGPYILFEDLFRPYITLLLLAPDSPRRSMLLKRAFDLTEELITSGGPLHDLAAIAVFEGQPSRWFQLAQPFLGRQSQSEIEEFGWNVSSDTPLDDPIDLYDVHPLVEMLLLGQPLEPTNQESNLPRPDREDRLSSNQLAELLADSLAEAGIVSDSEFRRAVEILEEEIDARKAVGDY